MKKLSKIFERQIFLFCLLVSAFYLLSLSSCKDDDPEPPYEAELDQLRGVLDNFNTLEKAIAAGYEIDVSGYVTGMGHHYLNPSLEDKVFEVDKPEVLLFAPDEDGVLQFVAVEYVTVIDDLDNPPPAPEGFAGEDDVWKIHTEHSLWTLHCWIELENEDGIFTPENSKIPPQ